MARQAAVPFALARQACHTFGGGTSELGPG